MINQKKFTKYTKHHSASSTISETLLRTKVQIKTAGINIQFNLKYSPRINLVFHHFWMEYTPTILQPLETTNSLDTYQDFECGQKGEPKLIITGL